MPVRTGHCRITSSWLTNKCTRKSGADFYDQETAIWIDSAGRLIEPVLMLGIGLVVGAIVLLLYSPIFDLANIV